MVALMLLSLVGCDAFNKAKNKVDGLLNPLVVEGIVLGVEPPENQDLQDAIGQSGFATGTSASLFLADAASVDDIENAPIVGADVAITGPGISVEVAEVDAGFYAHTPVQGSAPYTAGDTWTVSFGIGDSLSAATLVLPPESDFESSIPEFHDLNTPIDLDFTGLAYDGALVVVVNGDGDVTYSNEPDTVREVYDFTHGSNSPGIVTIPGEAFPTESIYAVGVAGMVNTDAVDLDNMNTVLSSVMTGNMTFYATSTLPLPLP